MAALPAMQVYTGMEPRGVDVGPVVGRVNPQVGARPIMGTDNTQCNRLTDHL